MPAQKLLYTSNPELLYPSPAFRFEEDLSEWREHLLKKDLDLDSIFYLEGALSGKYFDEFLELAQKTTRTITINYGGNVEQARDDIELSMGHGARLITYYGVKDGDVMLIGGGMVGPYEKLMHEKGLYQIAKVLVPPGLQDKGIGSRIFSHLKGYIRKNFGTPDVIIFATLHQAVITIAEHMKEQGEKIVFEPKTCRIPSGKDTSHACLLFEGIYNTMLEESKRLKENSPEVYGALNKPYIEEMVAFMNGHMPWDIAVGRIAQLQTELTSISYVCGMDRIIRDMEMEQMPEKGKIKKLKEELKKTRNDLTRSIKRYLNPQITGSGETLDFLRKDNFLSTIYGNIFRILDVEGCMSKYAEGYDGIRYKVVKKERGAAVHG